MIGLSEFLSVGLEGCQAGSDWKSYCSLEVEHEASATSSSLTVEIWQDCFPLAEGLDFPRSDLHVQACFQSSFGRECCSLICRVYSPASCLPSPPAPSGLLVVLLAAGTHTYRGVEPSPAAINRVVGVRGWTGGASATELHREFFVPYYYIDNQLE